MKKIILINNTNEVYELLKQKKKYSQLIVIDYRAAILCHIKKIKFLYIKDIYNNKNSEKLSNQLYSAYKIATKIDKYIRKKNKKFKNFNFFSNHFNFTKGYVFINYYYKYIKFIIKKYQNYEINYFANKKKIFFDFFIETIKLHRNNNKIKSIKIGNKKIINYYFSPIDDPKTNNLGKILSSIKNFSFYKKDLITFYLLEKSYIDLVKKYSIKNKKGFKNFNFTENKKSNLKLDTIKLFKSENKKLNKNVVIEKYINHIAPEIINTVLHVNFKILKYINQNQIQTFITSHNTLISNTIKELMLKKKIKVLNLLHGGTVGHFKNTFFWPTLATANQSNQNDNSYYQIYSQIQKKRVLSHNKIYNIKNKKKIYFNFGSEHFINLYKSKKNKVVRNQIAYIMQSNNNLFLNYSENQNDPYKLFLQRNNFLEKIKNHKNLKISISSPENNFDTVAEKKIINDLLIQKKLFLYKMNAVKILKSASVAILEQPSTTLIEAVCLKVPNIFVIKNPILNFDKIDYKNLNKTVVFINSLDDINLDKINKHKKIDRSFVENFYSTNKRKDFLTILNKILENKK